MIEADAQAIALFADCYHRNGGDPVAACVEARILNPMYSVTTIAAHVMERQDVQAAIATIKKARPNVSAAEVTRDSIIQDMQALHDRAAAAGDVKSAIAAKRLQAELLRLLGQDVTITHKLDVSQMTDEALMKIAAGKAVEGIYEDVTPKPKQGIAQLTQT